MARNRYIQAVQDYNITVRSFPTNLTAMMFGYEVKPNFTVENEQAISAAPTVSFGTRPRARRRPRRRRSRRNDASAPRGPACLRGVALLWLLGRGLTAAAQKLQPIPKLAARASPISPARSRPSSRPRSSRSSPPSRQRKGAQIAVLIVPTTEPEAIEQYSIRVAEQWKLGREKRVDDGALLLVAKDDHALRIEVGYGPRRRAHRCDLPTASSTRPSCRFPPGQFLRRHRAGLDQMMSVIDGEALPPPEHELAAPGAMATLRPVSALLFAVLIGSVVLRAIFGRTLGAAFTGVGAGFAGVPGRLLRSRWQAWRPSPASCIALLMGFAGGGSGWSSGPRGGLGGGWGGLGGGFGGGGFGGGGAASVAAAAASVAAAPRGAGEP